MSTNLKILKNVFINTKGNFLLPANIIFDTKIKDIQFLHSKEITLKQLSERVSKTEYINSIPKRDVAKYKKEYEGNFMILIPGGIDPHVHFDTPGFEFRDTFEHGTIAAAFGGVTTIIDMPCTSIPPVTSIKNFKVKLNAVKNRSLVDFAFWGGVRSNDFIHGIDVEKNIIDLSEAGVASFKAYLISGMDTFKDLNLEQMSKTVEIINKTDKPLGVHAENREMILERRGEYKENQQNTWEYYCSARDEMAELKAIEDMIKIGKQIPSKIHIVHLSSHLGLEAIKQAQKEGINITSETCPHYLEFTQGDFNNPKIRNYLKTAPPVKKELDRDALWSGLKDGSLLFLTTDHAGCNPKEEKISDNFWKVYGGIPGVEHRIPYFFSKALFEKGFTLEQCTNLVSKNVAEYFKLSSKGCLAPNKDADFALLNIWSENIISSKTMHSKGKYTPFDGIRVKVSVDQTFLRGEKIIDSDTGLEQSIGYGKFIEVN